MKNLILVIILCITFSQCTLQKENEYFDKRYKIIRVKIFKIEEKNNIYVYHFKNPEMNGIFATEKSCLTGTKSWKKINLNHTYSLILHRPLSANLRSGRVIETLNGEFVWDSDMKSIFFDDCLNICGNQIYEIKF